MNKRIAYITAGADTHYELEVIRTMSEQAFRLGCDLIVMTHFVNYTDGGSYIKGDENIYSLIKQLPLDGAIFNYNSYYSRELADRIDEMLDKKGIPVIAFDYASTHFESSIQNDRECFRELTEHFIREHGCRKIYCFSGPADDIHSISRINGYKDALRANGIAVRSKNIFYGDFWINSPRALAELLLSGTIEKPEAIVCGNDYMALQLSLSLISGGVRIPGEIAVGGFDGNPDVLRYQPSITTYFGANLNNAVNAVCRVYELITGEHVDERLHPISGIRTGASCGCRHDVSREAYNSQNAFDNSMLGNIYLHSSYSSMMNKVSTLDDCSLTIAQNNYLINEKSEMYICLCSNWEGSFDDMTDYRRDGYSDEMTCILSCKKMVCDGQFRDFPLRDIIPHYPGDNTPKTYICTPLHCLDRCYGYCVRCYTDDIVFEEYYGEFCQIAANAIERVRMLKYEEHLKARIQKLSERDMITGLFSRRGLENQLRKLDPNGRYFGVLYCYSSSYEDMTAEQAVAFTQAVNLSGAGTAVTARTAANCFAIVGVCDDLARPGQLFVNTMSVNLRNIEKQQNIDLTGQLVHFISTNSFGETPEEMIKRLEMNLESYKRSGSEKNSVYLVKIRKLHYLIYEDPHYQWDSADEAKKIGLSQSYFQHLYRQFTDVSFSADVISARVALAEKLLMSTSLSVSEIAERCGYPDASYFMKLFRKKTGMTALDYRKNAIKK